MLVKYSVSLQLTANYLNLKNKSPKFYIGPIVRDTDFCEFHMIGTKCYTALACDNTIAVLRQWLLF